MRLLSSVALLSVSMFFVGCGKISTDVRPSKGTEPMVRVLLADTMETVTLVPSGAYTATSDAGVSNLSDSVAMVLSPDRGSISMKRGDGVGEPVEAQTVTFTPQGASAMLVEDVPVGVGWWWESKESRVYEGVLTVAVTDDGKLSVVLELPVEEYLRGVVPSEIGGTSPAEALKAQAVAARSETMTALSERTYAGPGYDICADVNCQVFSGNAKRTPETDAAIKATRGIILSYDGKPIPAYYASNCGGLSEDIENVWSVRDRGIPCWTGRFDGDGNGPGNVDTESGARAWVEGRPEVFCNPDYNTGLPQWTHKNFRWEKDTTVDELTAFVAKKKDIGRVTGIEALERGVSGRMIKARFVGEKGSLEVGPELAIRQVWDPPLKSASFVVDRKGDTFHLTGAGYGHGVGMCQTGAIARAQAGQNFETILTHYYKDAVVEAIYD